MILIVEVKFCTMFITSCNIGVADFIELFFFIDLVAYSYQNNQLEYAKIRLVRDVIILAYFIRY